MTMNTFNTQIPNENSHFEIFKPNIICTIKYSIKVLGFVKKSHMRIFIGGFRISYSCCFGSVFVSIYCYSYSELLTVQE